MFKMNNTSGERSQKEQAYEENPAVFGSRSSASMTGPITLSIVTPGGRATVMKCESVRFNVPDGEKKGDKGGSVGIRKGHADALMSLDKCTVSVLSENGESRKFRVGKGMAMIGSNRVTFLTGEYSEANE